MRLIEPEFVIGGHIMYSPQARSQKRPSVRFYGITGRTVEASDIIVSLTRQLSMPLL